jgi:hypothetical protein
MPKGDQPRQSEEPVHFDLTTDDHGPGWHRLEVYRNKYKDYEGGSRGYVGKLFEFDIAGTKVYQRLLYRVDEDLKERRVTVENGVVVAGEKLDLEEQRKHEARPGIRYCILSTVMPHSFLVQERDRLSEAFAQLDEKAKQLGAVWDENVSTYFPEACLTEGEVESLSEFELDDILRQCGVSFREMLCRTYLLDVLDYLCNKEQFTRRIRWWDLEKAPSNGTRG